MFKDRLKVSLAAGKFVALSIISCTAYKVAQVIANANYSRGYNDAREKFNSSNEEMFETFSYEGGIENEERGEGATRLRTDVVDQRRIN